MCQTFTTINTPPTAMSKTAQTLMILLVFATSGIANAAVFDATNADADQWHASFGGSNAHNHALWLPGFLPGNDWLIDPSNPGIFDFNEGAGTATFTGSVFNENDTTATGDFSFNFVVSDTGTPKKELISAAYDPAPAGGGVDTDTWIYFDFAGPGTFEGTGGAASVLDLVFTQRGQSRGFKGQFGEGANGKNILLGYSAWFSWALDPNGVSFVQCPTVNPDCEGIGDININLNPVPLPAAAWLFGSALLGFIGFSRRRTI